MRKSFIEYPSYFAKTDLAPAYNSFVEGASPKRQIFPLTGDPKDSNIFTPSSTFKSKQMGKEFILPVNIVLNIAPYLKSLLTDK